MNEQPASSWIRETSALAELENDRGNYQPADQLFTEAAQRLGQLATTEPDLAAQVLLGRAGTSALLDRTGQARQLFQQAMQIGERQALANVRVEALEGLAMTEFYANDMGAAERYYQQALAARIAYSGATHPKVSESLTGLANTALSRGDRRQAEEYLLRVYAADQKLLGDKHPNLAPTLMSLGRVRLERREFAKAIEVLEHGVTIMATQQSDTHEDLVFGYSNLALARLGHGEARLAEPALDRALAIAINHDHALQGPIRVYQADLYCRTGRAQLGLQRLEQARPMVAARYPDDPWRLALVDSVRAGCLTALHRYREAQRLVDTSTPTILRKWPADTLYGSDARERAARLQALAGSNPTQLQ